MVNLTVLVLKFNEISSTDLLIRLLTRSYVSGFKEIKGDNRFDNCNFCHDPFNFQISAFVRPISRVDDTQARLPSSVRSDFKRVDQRGAESVENVAHIRERFGFQASHDYRYRLAQFGARLPRAHSVLHYRYNIIQSDVKLIIDFLPPTSKRYHADASRLLPRFPDCEVEAFIVSRAISNREHVREKCDLKIDDCFCATLSGY